MESFEPKQEIVADDHHKIELRNKAQMELILEFAQETGKTLDEAARIWIQENGDAFRKICDDSDCLERLENDHEAMIKELREMLPTK